MIKKFSNKLPTILQTDTQKEFFSATFDQLFSPAEVEQAQGFIGQRSSGVFNPREDNYLGEPTKLRAAYQLEPIAYAVNTALEDTNEVFYEDLVNYIEFRGGDVSNHDRLFADTFYSFAPPIDVDKYLNYQNYLWLENGGPTIYIQAPGISGAAFDSIIENQIIGATQFNTSENEELRPRGLDLSSGMRVRFEGSASYDRPLWIEGVGREIRLVEELTTQTGGVAVITIPWDNSLIVEGSAGTGYTITMDTGSIDHTLQAAGTGYEAGDVVSVLSPNNEGVTTPATITIDTVGGSGEILTYTLSSAGSYLFAPNSQVSVGGTVYPSVPGIVGTTIATQDETNFDGVGNNGTFAAGTGYVNAEVITLDDNTTVTVDTVDGGGAVLTFDITTETDQPKLKNATLSQTGSTGVGTGFSLTLGDANEKGSGAVFTLPIEGELITVSGGTFVAAAELRPTEVTASGVVETLDIVDRGDYSIFPTSPAATTAGTGTGLLVNLFENGDTGELFDSDVLGTIFDSSVDSDLSVSDYLTVERGSIEGSPWSRTNRWFNVDIVNTAQTLGQIIEATIVSGGINYLVGDQLPVDGDGINGIITVTSVDGAGSITGIRVSGRGQGYTFGGVDQTGEQSLTDTVLWDATDPTPNPSGESWDTSFGWDEVITSGGGQDAVIDITLASATDRSTKAERPILEFRRDLELYSFGNQYIMEVQVVADNELYADVDGQPAGTTVDGVELKDGMRLIFLDPSQIPQFFEWDDEPLTANPGASYWDTFAWEAEGAAGAVSRFIWQVEIGASGTISLIQVDPVTGLPDAGAPPVPEGGVVVATQGDEFAGRSFYQYRDPLGGEFTWREGQQKVGVNDHPLYQLYDYNGIALDDPIEYDTSTFTGNEIFSYRVLTAADIADTGGSLTADTVLGFPLTLTGLRQISDIVFENDLETNRVTNDGTEIPGYYFFKEWIVDTQGDLVRDADDVGTSTYKTNWLASPEPERQRVIDRFLTDDDTTDSFMLSTMPRSNTERFDIRVNEGRRLNTDEFAYIESTGEIKIFEKPIDTGFEIADGTDSLFSFTGITEPAEVYINGFYEERGLDYKVINALQLKEIEVSVGGTGYAVNDELVLVGGTFDDGRAGKARVVSVAPGGIVTGVFISDVGVYITTPSSPVSTTTDGVGTDCVLTAMFEDATANTFTIQFTDSDGVTPRVIAADEFVEVREQGSGAPGKDSVIEVIYSTLDELTDDDIGFFEIPNGLENNPNNLEITENSWNQFTPHMVSIIENQDTYLGTAFGSVNNYRDTAKDGSQGEYILQTQAPLLKTMLAASSNELDIVEALRFSGKEYARYKNKFTKEAKNLIDQGFTPFNDGDSIPIDQWVDEAVRRIIRSREYANAFEDTYMFAYGTVFEEETYDFVSTVTSGTVDRNFNTVTNFVDLEDKRNAMYVYVDETIQRIDEDYTISNLNPIEIEWINVPTGTFTITVRLYENMAPSHIPATPQKLGLAPIFIPRVITDDSYRTPISVLVNHDGSKTPLYGDYRDDLLFEFETRIYNGIIDQFRNDYELPLAEDTYKPGRYRNTRWDTVEWNRLMRANFFKWVAASKADYITNEFYDANDPWTWNYSEVLGTDGEALPGYWRGIFDYYYDTQTPQTTPWEMLGFAEEPSWWETEYGAGPWDNTSPMWTDLENGTIKDGYRAGTDERYARSGLTTNSIPVDAFGALLSTPLECIANDNSLTDPTTVQAAKPWQYGDQAPVEYAWRIGEEFSFAVSEALFLARPGEYGEQFWDPEHTFVVPINELQVVSDDNSVYKRVGNDTLAVHGETISGVKQVNTGWQVWVSNRLRALGKNLGNDFGQLIRTLDVKLGHKMASFTNKDTLSVTVEGISTASQANNLLIPQENINVSLHTGAPVREYVYGGVLIRAQADGTFQLFGYDILNGEFNYIPRLETSARNTNINVGGQPESFTIWQAGTTYNANSIVRFNSIYYRAIETHSSNTFDQTQWAKLSKLPTTGGINVTYKPVGSGDALTLQYGATLDTPQQVFDFIIGYGEWLNSEGWIFENMNPETGTPETWLSAAKQYLLWTQSNWEANSIVMISPAATGATLEVSEGYPAAVEKITNGVYSILDKQGVVIDPRNTIIKRVDRSISILPAIEQTGIYGARINTTETESILTFDNVTDFNDTIYDPLLGSRLARVYFNGKRTLNWTGKLEAGGYIITDNKLIPNFENMVDSIRFYHDTETIVDNVNKENAARHLIGFSERDYYEDLQIENDSQYQFYQGAIRQKGTVQSIRRLERSTKVGDATRDTEVYEEWALKTNEYGHICGNQTLEFFISANEVKVDPQLVVIDYPANSNASGSKFFGPSDISGGAVLMPAHGYSPLSTVRFTLDGLDAIPELSSGDLYVVTVVDDDTFTLSTVANPTVALSLTNPGGSSSYKLETIPAGYVASIDIVSNTNTVYASVPTVTIVNHPDDAIGYGATALAVLDTDSTLLRIDVLTAGYGYILPPTVYIGDTIIDDTDDRAVALLAYNITVDDPTDDIILIDADDNVRWPTKPRGIECSGQQNIFPVEAQADNQYIVGATVNDGGTGYTVNDVLTLQGGNATVAATVTVTAVSGGVITNFILNGGRYITAPTGEVALQGGTGQDATVNVTVETRKFTDYNARMLPNAGNVSILDTDYRFVSTAGLDALATLASPPSRKGETINVAYGENEDWAVYLLNDLTRHVESLLIERQVDAENPIYAAGRIYTNLNLSSIGEDRALSQATLTYSTSGGNTITNVTVTNSGYGYWEDSVITISSATDSNATPDGYAVVPITSIDGVFALNVPQRTVLNQQETSFTGVGNEGTFTAGTGFVNGDRIEMSDGSLILVNNVDGSAVAEFIINGQSTTSFNTLGTLTQVEVRVAPYAPGDVVVGRSGFTLSLGGANAELVNALGSGYAAVADITPADISELDIPGPKQSGRYLSNTTNAGTGKLYVNNILYDYTYSGAQTATAVSIVGRGSGYAVEDELSVNGGFSLTSPALITVNSLRTIASQTHTSFDGVSPNGSFVAGASYNSARNTFNSSDLTGRPTLVPSPIVSVGDDDVYIAAHGYTTGDSVVLRNGGTLPEIDGGPATLTNNGVYYIIAVDDDLIQFAATAADALAGVAINMTSTGSGVHELSDTIVLDDTTLITVDAVGRIPLVAQDETDYNGAGTNGTFTAGEGYVAADTITLEDGTSITVDAVSGNDKVIVGQNEINYNGAGGSGTFSTGVGYTVGEVVTMSDGCTVVINNETAGVVSEFEILTGTVTPFAGGATLTQASTTGAGSGFQLNTAADINTDDFGDIIDFTVSAATGEGVVTPGTAITQESTDGNGTGFTLTLNTANYDITATGEVNEFTIDTSGTALTSNGTTQRQAATTSDGTGFELTLGTANEEILDFTLTTGGDYSVEPEGTVTVNGGSGTGATFTLDTLRPLYDMTKDGVAVEDGTFADDTEFFVLTDIRYRNTTNRDNFADEDIAAGMRTVWLDDNDSGVWEVQDVTAPILAAQDETDYDGTWTITSGDHGTFFGGASHEVSDVITLSDGSTVTVVAIGDEGVVTEFTITTAGNPVQFGDTLEQVSTTGTAGGIAFSLTIDSHNLDNDNITYSQRAIQDTLIDTKLFKNAFVYEADTADTVAQLPVYDPFKGIIPGAAELNLRWIARRDPARYNNAATDVLLSDTRLFDSEQVGLLWWDLSTCAYLYYEQGTDTYRRDNWGALIEGSSIDVYEWTRSTKPPAQYEGDGTVRSTTEYTQAREYDRQLEETRTFYYFWVKDRTVVPEGVERTLAGFEVGRLLSNPASQQFQWFAPISQSGFMFAGVEGTFTDSDNIVQINYRRTQDEEPQHVEWQLGREGDVDYMILPVHWDKMVDSLCGFTDLVAIGNKAYTDTIATFFTQSGVVSGTDIITTDAAHGFTTGDGVYYSVDGGVDTVGLTDGVMYYVNSLSTTTLTLHATRTDAIGAASEIDLTSAATNETHSLTAPTTALNNFRNALPSADDVTQGYLIVPDPDLSDTERYGIETRPLQTMFVNRQDARRIFVDKVNELMEFVNLRDENPSWNSSMTTNTLWEWIDWYKDGWDATNAVPTFQVDAISALDNITQIIDGDIVRVTGTRWRLYEYDEDADTFTLIGREASRLSLLSDIYTADESLANAIELRELITALTDSVFTVDRLVNKNLVFFAMLNYVFSEQEDLDWAFKTTYVYLKQQGRTLTQERVYQNDPFDAALDFIEEFKPYQTKIRDFRTERAAELDLVPGTAEELNRDFSVDIVYDRIRGGDLSIAEMRIAKNAATDSRWDGYTTKDAGVTDVRLGAAGRFAGSQNDLLVDVASIDSDIFDAYVTNPVQAVIEVTVGGAGDIISATATTNGQGYYTSGSIVVTTASGFGGNDNAVINYSVDTSFAAKGAIETSLSVSAGGNGYTPGTYNIAVADMPAFTSVELTEAEITAVAAINERITDTFAFDYEGLFLQNTEFTGNPSLIAAEIVPGGTGYVVGDIVTLDAGSGTPITSAQFRVEAIDGGGDITELLIINGGSYQLTPTVDPVDLLGGTGSGATVTNLIFETGSTVPFDTTPHDQIGWDSSVFDPSVAPLEGTPLDLYRTITGQTHVDFNGVPSTEGSFVGGSGHAVSDVINLNDGTEITVNTVATVGLDTGVVTQFTITGGSTTSNMTEATLTQTSTDGAGIDFSLTLGAANQSSANFFDVPPEETFTGTGSQKEFTLTTNVITPFLYVALVDPYVGILEQTLNVDYFFIADELYFISHQAYNPDTEQVERFAEPPPATSVNNIQIYSYIEAGDLINPQVREGVTEEMVPLDPRENLVIIADTTGATNVSFTIHEDTQQGISFYRNSDAASTTTASNVTTTDSSIAIADSLPLDPQPDWDNPVEVWIGTELIQYHGVAGTYTIDSLDAISAAGTGYTAGDILTIDGNTVGAVTNALITVDTVGGSGEITGATLTVPGTYKESPGDTNVSATGGSILAQDETNFDNSGANGTWTGGNGYSIADSITLDDGTVVTVDAVDQEATLTFDTDGSGIVTAVNITDGGSGYVSGGTFTITVASDGGFVAGQAAIIGYSVSGGAISSIDSIATNSGYSNSLSGVAINTADVPNPTNGGVTEFTIASITTGASEKDPGAATVTLDQSSVAPAGGLGFTLILDTNNQTGNDDATFNLTISTSSSALLGCRRGYRGTHPQAHLSGVKVFGTQSQELPDPNTYWTVPVTTNDYNGVAGQWRFVGETAPKLGATDGQSSIHFSDTGASAFAANVSVGDVLVVTDTTVGQEYLITDLIAIGELGIVDITAPGTGYEVGDVIDIDTLASGGTGVTAEVGAVDGDGGIVYVRITSRGSSYTDVGALTIPDTEFTSTSGAGAELEVYFDTEGLECALPNRILDVNGIVAEVDTLTWQVNGAAYSITNASNTNVNAVFLQAGPGSAL